MGAVMHEVPNHDGVDRRDRFGADYPPEGPAARLVRVVLDRLPELIVAPLLHPRRCADPRRMRRASATTL